VQFLDRPPDGAKSNADDFGSSGGEDLDISGDDVPF